MSTVEATTSPLRRLRTALAHPTALKLSHEATYPQPATTPASSSKTLLGSSRMRTESNQTTLLGTSSRMRTESNQSVSDTKSAVRQMPASASRPPRVAVFTGGLLMDGTWRMARMLMFLVIGVATSAIAVVAEAWPSVLKRLALVESYGLGPLYLALVLLFLAYHTAGIQLGTVYRPTQIQMPDNQIYRVLDGGPGVSGALVLAQDGGSFAKYVRTQQAAASLEESMPLFLALLIASGFVMPWTAMALAATFGLARAMRAAEAALQGFEDRSMSGFRSGNRSGSSISLAAEGIAAGVCLFVGLVATAKELTELKNELES